MLSSTCRQCGGGGAGGTRTGTSGAVLDLSGTAPQGPDLPGRRRGRVRIRIRAAAVRPGNGRDQARPVRAPGRARARADETLSRGGRLVAGKGSQVQRVRDRSGAVRRVQRDLRALLPGGVARPDIPVRAVLSRAARYRDRLRRGYMSPALKAET